MSDHEHDTIGDTPTDAELEVARRSVEASLGDLGTGLGDPALWVEPVGALEDRIVASAAPPPTKDRKSTAGRWRWVGAAAVVTVLLGLVGLTQINQPDWTVELESTADFPSAGGVVEGWNVPSGTRMVVNMAGVDPAPDGFFYEMWLSDGPIHVSGGTFTEVSGVELLAGVARSDYPRVWVTLEPIDEDESPSPVVVVDTTR